MQIRALVGRAPASATISLFIFDHSEILGDRASPPRADASYEGAVRVQLVISWPRGFLWGGGRRLGGIAERGADAGRN